MRGGPRENQGYGNGDNNQMSYNEYQVCQIFQRQDSVKNPFRLLWK